ncbi:unnamed protein product [Paramecium sonneborni]|uniref:Uncharacterized protein n=1 Tax=Paramecium sonneborni TaxID=65129 RepID=A0A8S1RHW5_9CILI|nr:unnamed protein product [Paramecium sonneborni]
MTISPRKDIEIIDGTISQIKNSKSFLSQYFKFVLLGFYKP